LNYNGASTATGLTQLKKRLVTEFGVSSGIGKRRASKSSTTLYAYNPIMARTRPPIAFPKADTVRNFQQKKFLDRFAQIPTGAQEEKGMKKKGGGSEKVRTRQPERTGAVHQYDSSVEQPGGVMKKGNRGEGKTSAKEGDWEGKTSFPL